MKELAYYSVFAIILYFVLIQVFENFNIEQENFDPSLVPVSSIVTLAKVAQKLVNGNGTLTNPGNLQIGASASTPGNLTVTGSILNGGLTIKGGSASPDSTLLQFGDGTGWRARIGKAGSPTLDIYDNAGGGVQVTGNLSTTGNLNVTGDSVSNLGKPSRINLKDIFNGHPGITTEATDRPLWILAGNKEVNIGHPDASLKNRLYVSGNTVLAGNLDIAGNVNGNVNLPGGDISVKGTVELKDRQGGGSKQVLYNDGDVLGLWSSTQNKRTFYVDRDGSMGNTGSLDIAGNLTAKGNNSFKGAGSTPAGAGDMKTHFPNSDGNNYIRGNTHTSGSFNVGGSFNVTNGLSASGGSSFGFNGSGGGQTLTASIKTGSLAMGKAWQGSDCIASNSNDRDLIITANRGVSILGCDFNAGNINVGGNIYKRLPDGYDWGGNDINHGNFNTGNLIECANGCISRWPGMTTLAVWWAGSTKCYCKTLAGWPYADGNTARCQAYKIM